MTIDELVKDPEFTKRFPYVWNKLELLFLQRQREFAKKHAGNYELTGRFIEFMSEIMDDLNNISSTIHLEIQKPKRAKLHNVQFREPADTPTP